MDTLIYLLSTYKCAHWLLEMDLDKTSVTESDAVQFCGPGFSVTHTC